MVCLHRLPGVGLINLEQVHVAERQRRIGRQVHDLSEFTWQKSDILLTSRSGWLEVQNRFGARRSPRAQIGTTQVALRVKFGHERVSIGGSTLTLLRRDLLPFNSLDSFAVLDQVQLATSTLVGIHRDTYLN